MCGIAGWVNRMSIQVAYDSKKSSGARVQVSKILDLQQHRGPDGRGLWTSPDLQVVFGHNRLAIVELSDAGAQPMIDAENEWAITYNGELYNHKALRSTLQNKHGVRFRGKSDTEVFLYGVKTWGIDEFLRIADGMFAAALYCKNTQTCFLVRDRVGEKPLYYAETIDGLYFASELRPLSRGIGSAPKIDKAGLCLYMMMRYIPAPLTIYSDYKKLRPGHFLVIEPGRAPREYAHYSWDPHASELPQSAKTFDQLITATENFLTTSLESRLMSDVPLGFFLSGGVDSSLIVALARKHFGTQLRTYTIAFSCDPKSEHVVAEETAKTIGTVHSTRIFEAHELNQLSRQVIQSMDEPNGDRSCIPTYLLSKHARSEVTVALGGDGGDELFGGYQRYLGLNQQISTDLFPRAYDGLLWYLSHRLPVFTPQAVIDILYEIPEDAKNILENLAVHLYFPARPEIDIRYIDFKSYLPGAVLAKVDRMSMQASLEVRTPFLTGPVLDLASRLPYAFLYGRSHPKVVLRELCSRLGLKHLASLPKKGFGMPSEFLSQDLADLKRRAVRAVETIENRLGAQLRIGQLARYVGANANSIWATIVLGEWLESDIS